jgi:hypothetical protein
MPGSTPLHNSALFTEMDTDLFHYGTRRCGQSRNPKRLCDSRADDRFPNSESFLSRVLDHTTFTYEPFALIDQYVEAFSKIYDHQDELRDLAARKQGQQPRQSPG